MQTSSEHNSDRKFWTTHRNIEGWQIFHLETLFMSIKGITTQLTLVLLDRDIYDFKHILS